MGLIVISFLDKFHHLFTFLRLIVERVWPKKNPVPTFIDLDKFHQLLLSHPLPIFPLQPEVCENTRTIKNLLKVHSEDRMDVF